MNTANMKISQPDLISVRNDKEMELSGCDFTQKTVFDANIRLKYSYNIIYPVKYYEIFVLKKYSEETKRCKWKKYRQQRNIFNVNFFVKVKFSLHLELPFDIPEKRLICE